MSLNIYDRIQLGGPACLSLRTQLRGSVFRNQIASPTSLPFSIFLERKFLWVFGCKSLFERGFHVAVRLGGAWEKSMLFCSGFLLSGHQDDGVLKGMVVDGVESLD